MLSSNTRSPLHRSICASAAETSIKGVTSKVPRCQRMENLQPSSDSPICLARKSAPRGDQKHDDLANLFERAQRIAGLAADLVEREPAHRCKAQGEQRRRYQALREPDRKSTRLNSS